MDAINLLTLTIDQLRTFFRKRNLAIIKDNSVIIPLDGQLLGYLKVNDNWSLVSQEGLNRGTCLACIVQGEYIEPGALKPDHAKKIGFRKDELDRYNSQKRPLMTLESELGGVDPIPNPFAPKINRQLAHDAIDAMIECGAIPKDYFKSYRERSKSIGTLSPGLRVISITKGPGTHVIHNIGSKIYKIMMAILPYEFRPKVVVEDGNFFWKGEGAFTYGRYVPPEIKYKVGRNEMMVTVARLGSNITYTFSGQNVSLKEANPQK